jgi:hypothetical protein
MKYSRGDCADEEKAQKARLAGSIPSARKEGIENKTKSIVQH